MENLTLFLCIIKEWHETLREWNLGKSYTIEVSISNSNLISFTYQIIVVGCANILRVILRCRARYSLLWNSVGLMRNPVGLMTDSRYAKSCVRWWEPFVSWILVDPKWTHERVLFFRKEKVDMSTIQVCFHRRAFGKVERLISFIKSRITFDMKTDSLTQHFVTIKQLNRFGSLF